MAIANTDVSSKPRRGSAPGERRGGRQKGTPNKSTASVKELAGKYGPDAIEALVQIMKEGEGEAARVAACRELLDRAYGKASQIVGSDPDNPLPTNIMVAFKSA